MLQMLTLLSVAVLALPLQQGCDHEQELGRIEGGLHASDAGHPVAPPSVERACDGSASPCPASGGGTAPLPSKSCDESRYSAAPETAAVDAGLTNSPSFSTLALRLDGTSEYIRLGDLSFPTGSISMWLQTSSGGFLFSKLSPGGRTTGELRLYITQGRLRLRIDENEQDSHETGSNFTPLLNDGQWHHVLVTFNPGMKAFVDGREQKGFDAAVDNLTGLTLSGVDAELGRNNAHEDTYYAGLIDEVALFDRALSADEVLSIHNGGIPGDLHRPGVIPAPNHWWRLGEGDVPPIANDSAGSVQGTLVNIDDTNFVTDTSSTSSGCVTD